MNKKLAITMLAVLLVCVMVLPIVDAQLEGLKNLIPSKENLEGLKNLIPSKEKFSGVANTGKGIFKNLTNTTFLVVYLISMGIIFIGLKKMNFTKEIVEGNGGSKISLFISLFFGYGLTTDLVITQGQTIQMVLRTFWTLAGIGFFLFAFYAHQEGGGYKYLMPIGAGFGMLSALIAPYSSLWGSVPAAGFYEATVGWVIICGGVIPILFEAIIGIKERKRKNKYGEEGYEEIEKKLEEKRIELEEAEKDIEKVEKEAEEREEELQEKIKGIEEGEKEAKEAKEIVSEDPSNVSKLYPHLARTYQLLPSEDTTAQMPVIDVPFNADKISRELEESNRRKAELLKKIKEEFGATKPGKQATYLIALMRRLESNEGGRVWVHYVGANWDDVDNFAKEVEKETQDKDISREIARGFHELVVKKKEKKIDRIEFVKKFIKKELKVLNKKRKDVIQDIEATMNIEGKAAIRLVMHQKKFDVKLKRIEDSQKVSNQRFGDMQSRVEKLRGRIKTSLNSETKDEDRKREVDLIVVGLEGLKGLVGNQNKSLKDVQKGSKKIKGALSNMKHEEKVFHEKVKDGALAESAALSEEDFKKAVKRGEVA